MAVFLEKQCSQDQYQVFQQLSPWRILLCFIRKLMQSGAELDLSIIMSSETENAERTEKPMVGQMELAIDSRPIASAFRSGVTWVSNVYGHMHKHARLGGLGDACSPGKF